MLKLQIRKYILDLLTESFFSHLHPTKLSLTIFDYKATFLKTPHKTICFIRFSQSRKINI